VYKVGDTIKIRSKEYFRNLPDYDESGYGVPIGAYFTDIMFIFCGRKFIIESETKANIILRTGDPKIYGDLDKIYAVRNIGKYDSNDEYGISNFKFSEYMFEKLAQQFEFSF